VVVLDLQLVPEVLTESKVHRSWFGFFGGSVCANLTAQSSQYHSTAAP
jgi:hypothetical protein